VGGGKENGRKRDAYSTYNIIVVGEVCLAVLATEDLGRVEVDIVC
jgi:hypothetical protein